MATPIGYQNVSEGYLRKAGDAFGRMGAGGSNLSGIGRGLYGQYRRTFAPLQQRLAATAELNPDDLVNQAGIDVNLAFDKARGIQNRNLSRMGISPESGRYRGLQQQLALAQAAAEAGAKTRARRTGRRESFGRMLQAAQLGQNLPGAATQALSAGSRIGAAAGQGFRALAGDYGSLAGASEKAKMMGNFPMAISNLFGTQPDMSMLSDAADRMRRRREMEEYLAWKTRAENNAASAAPMPYNTQPQYMGGVNPEYLNNFA